MAAQMQGRFRVHYRYRTWIGKPESYGPYLHGTAYIASDNYSWLHERINKLRSDGHQVICIQRLEGDKYVTI